MGRKKEIRSGFHLKFIPEGRYDDLKALADAFPYVKDKHIALCKYVEAFSSIVERSWNVNNAFVGVSQRILRDKLGLENISCSKLLQDLVDKGFLNIGKSDFKAGVTAWKYKPIYTKLETVALSRQAKFITKKTDDMLTDQQKLNGDLKIYRNVLKKITVSNEVYQYMNDVYNQNNTITYNINDTKNNNNMNMIYCESLVPNFKDLIETINGECESLIPVRVLGKVPVEFVPIIKLIGNRFKVYRRSETGRVYTNITNLARGYRPFLRLNNKSLIGFDIANSQPLIAAVLFKMHSEKVYDCIREDVAEYQKACQTGRFYEYFMDLNGIDTTCDDARTAFKKEFFGKVFYTKEVEKENYLKTQFKEKYPTCYEAIFNVKGGFYSEDYKLFPKYMTEIETSIMWETNVELIKEGFDVVNIFDSLYSDSEEAISKAKELVRAKFEQFGISPMLKDISYQTDLNDLQLDEMCESIQSVDGSFSGQQNEEKGLCSGNVFDMSKEELMINKESIVENSIESSCQLEENICEAQPLEYFIESYGYEDGQIMYEEQFEAIKRYKSQIAKS